VFSLRRRATQLLKSVLWSVATAVRTRFPHVR
jgi:hypothetical protein